MSAPNRNGYLLLSRTDEWYQQLSHAELQKLIADNKAWVGRLMAEGKARPGVALAREGATVFAYNKRVILDGPYAESKEAICGTLVLDVATLDEAIAIAKACPSLRHNSALEIRPISDECPLEACAREKEKQLAPAA
ncbi:MAG: hypothetical protein HOP33_00835 [Verrucomicrobia bacterium]|nr:hypothetical protein [Verrucomicrobiota bacterium]